MGDWPIIYRGQPVHPGPLSPRERRMRWGILGLSSLPILGAVAHQQGWPIPLLVCPLRHYTGIPCPTCGMTRSFLALVQGDWSEAIHYHLFGPLLFGAFVIAALHVLVELQRNRALATVYTRWLGQPQLQLASTGLLLVYHGYRLRYLAQTGELAAAIAQSPLGHLLQGG